jgi:hypothetical protein
MERVRGGPTAWPPRFSALYPLDFYLWEHLKTLMYATLVNNEKALHHRTVDACQTIHNYPYMFERMLRSMMRLAEVCTEHLS